MKSLSKKIKKYKRVTKKVYIGSGNIGTGNNRNSNNGSFNFNSANISGIKPVNNNLPTNSFNSYINNELNTYEEKPQLNIHQKLINIREDLYRKKLAVPVNLLIFDAELKLHQEYSRMFNNIMKVVEDNSIINQESIQEKMKQIDIFTKM